MIKFDLVEDRFSVNETSLCRLSILVGMDSFAYMVVDERENVKIIREYDFDKRILRNRWLDQILTSDKWLQHVYKDIRIAVDDPQVALSPKRLFKEEDKLTYLTHLSASLNAGAEVVAEEVDDFGVVLVYHLLPEIKLRLLSSFPYPTWTHLNVCLLKALRQHAGNQAGFHLWVMVKEKELKIFAFDRSALHFMNVFPFFSAHDFLYYTTMVCQQIGVKPADTPVFLTGRLMADSEIFRRMERYFPRLSFQKPLPTPIPGEKTKTLPGYFFADLFVIHQSA